MEFKTTFTATKGRTIVVPFVGMPTARTLLRSVSSIYKETYALTGKLVGCIVVIYLIPGLILSTQFCGDIECIGVGSHRIEKSLTILVSQPEPERLRGDKHALLPNLMDGVYRAATKMNSILKKATSIVLIVFCLLPLAMMEDSLASDAQMNDSVTGPTLVFPEAAVAVDDRSLDGALKIYSPFVLDCWELGCRPCQLIDPKINQMAEDFKGRIVFGKLCIDDNPITMSKYGVSRTPTLLVLKNGTLVYKHVGNYPKEELEKIILTVLHMR